MLTAQEQEGMNLAPAPSRPVFVAQEHPVLPHDAGADDLEALSASPMAQKLLRKAAKVKLLLCRGQVRVWLVQTAAKRSYVLKWMPDCRVDDCKQQVLAELRAAKIFQEMHGRPHPFFCCAKAIEISSAGTVMVYMYAGESAAQLKASKIRELSIKQREPIVKAMLTSHLKAITFLEAVPEHHGGRHLHRDIKLDNTCGRQVASGLWIFPLIDFGGFIPTDGRLDDFFGMIDMRYLDTLQAAYNEELDEHALDSAEGLYATTHPSLDVRSAGLAALELLCGLPAAVDPHHYDMSCPDERRRFLEQVAGFRWLPYLRDQMVAGVMSAMMAGCFAQMLNSNPSLRSFASEVLADAWLAGEEEKLDKALAAAADDWAAADQELREILGEEVGDSSAAWAYCPSGDAVDDQCLAGAACDDLSADPSILTDSSRPVMPTSAAGTHSTATTRSCQRSQSRVVCGTSSNKAVILVQKPVHPDSTQNASSKLMVKIEKCKSVCNRITIMTHCSVQSGRCP